MPKPLGIKPSEKLDEYAHTLFDNVQKGYFCIL